MDMQSEATPEIWGGIECTFNRVGDQFIDQLQLSGFYNDPAQMKALLSLGIKALRFPVLWEKHQPQEGCDIDFAWAAASLDTLQKNNIEPIVGLLHHGSGPGYTNLSDEKFPYLFAEYAGRVAAEFPWIKYYVPVNEPLTTARFSGLYGLWYPHDKTEINFVRMLLNELKASVLAMREIRKVNPNAKMIQTEDLGKTYSSELLSYQADFENQRRWLTYDILCGMFDKDHALWHYFINLGIEEDALQFFIDHPCPPDLIGVNHYITSERYLDENIEKYTSDKIGGNHIHRYADIEAARVQLHESNGLDHLLQELWERYNIPIAITEAHLHCTREEQLRWLKYVYEVTVKLKRKGVDVRAVTAWALLGSFGWNKLLTCPSCEYESGAFDISAGDVRTTATAAFVRKIGNQNRDDHPLLLKQGWWKSKDRFFNKVRNDDNEITQSSVRPLLIIGKTGTLGRAFAKICAGRNIHYLLLGREEVDIAHHDQVEKMIARYQPWAVVNAAGYVRVDEAEEQQEACFKENLLGVQCLADLCTQHRVKLLAFSSDQVFDGEKEREYNEDDACNPLNVYGKSKHWAEVYLREHCPDALIIRTAAFFGPWDQYNFVSRLLSSLREGIQFIAADDNSVSPTYVPHLVNEALNLLIDDATGIWHLTNKGNLTWYQFAIMVVGYTSYSSKLVIPSYNMQQAALRPKRSALGSKKYNLMPSLENALREYFLASAFSELHMSKQIPVYERV